MPLTELTPGSILGVELPSGARVCLVNHGGVVRAVEDVCSHQAFPLSAGELMPDGTIECPWHGARFDCRTGEVRQGPASEPVRTYEVRVEDGMVQVREP